MLYFGYMQVQDQYISEVSFGGIYLLLFPNTYFIIFSTFKLIFTFTHMNIIFPLYFARLASLNSVLLPIFKIFINKNV